MARELTSTFEVSHPAVSLLRNVAARAGVAMHELTAKLPVEAQALERVGSTMSWEHFTLGIDTLVERVGYARLEAACRDLPAMVPDYRVLASVFVSPSQLYRFINEVHGPSMYPMIQGHWEGFDDGTFKLTLRLRPGFRGCKNFFRLNAACEAAVPAFIGLPHASVRARNAATRSTLWIMPPVSRTLAARVHRSARRIFHKTALRALEIEKRRVLEAYKMLWEREDELSMRQEALEREMQLRGQLEEALWDVAQTVQGAGYMVERGKIRPLNATARACLERAGAALHTRIRAAATGTDTTNFDVTPIDAERCIVISRRREDVLRARLEQATQRWGLTKRQTEVLAGLARGLTNKELASELGCRVKTIEAHVGEVLRRSGASSRLALLTALWT